MKISYKMHDKRIKCEDTEGILSYLCAVRDN